MSQAVPERRRGKLEGMDELVPGAVDFVWQAKARAEAARARAEGLWREERQTPASSAEAEAMVLALRDRFGGRPDEEVDREAQERLSIARTPEARRKVEEGNEHRPSPASSTLRHPPQPRPLSCGEFAQEDDNKTADAMWLQFQLAQVPKFNRSALGMAAGATKFSRGAWRAALGGVLQKPPPLVSSPVGLLKVLCRQVHESGIDPRREPNYCAQPGWGMHAYRMAGVAYMIHQAKECRCG